MAEPKKSSEETVQAVQEVFRFPCHLTIDRYFEAADLVPARMIEFNKTEISAIGSWWSTEITENLDELALSGCKISLANLLAMLQRTPNLRFLILDCGSTLVYNAAVEKFSDLRLQKMEYLSLFELKQSKVMEVFIRTFPRLKVFEFDSGKTKSCGRFFDAMAASDGWHTLKELMLVFSTPNHVSRSARVKHKKRMSRSLQQDGNTTKCLKKAFGNLPHLKRLSIHKVPDVTNLPGLERLTELVYFTLEGCTHHQRISFSGMKHPNLEELSLYNATPIPGELQEYIGHSPKLRKIILQHCVLDSWAELFDAVHPEEFRHLELHDVKVSTDASLLGYFDGLRSLKLKCCNMTKDFLLTLLGRCPRLEELALGGIEYDCDDVVLVACQKITELRELTLRCCPITDVALKNIAEHDPNLEQLTITHCDSLTSEAITQFRSTRSCYCSQF